MRGPIHRVTTGTLTTSAGGAASFALEANGLLSGFSVVLGSATGCSVTVLDDTTGKDLLDGTGSGLVATTHRTPDDFGVQAMSGNYTVTITGGGNTKTLTCYLDIKAGRYGI